MPRTIPIWGFPVGYNPNEWKDRCEICHRYGLWVERQLPGKPFSAWTCSACAPLPNRPVVIPD